MRLPIPARDTRRDLREFDVWITPSIEEITDTPTYKAELTRVTRVFEALGKATSNFADERHCSPAAIAQTLARLADGLKPDDRTELSRSLASTLYLVTGKSDNNAKCQFPLYLRDVARWATFPISRSGRIQERLLPRVLKSDDVMATVAAAANTPHEARLLEQFVSFLLSGEDTVRQFWSVGYSYYGLKRLGRGYERNLLAPLVIFKVRGSATASGGHKPEAMLRDHLAQWGLLRGVDFNEGDVVLRGAEETAQRAAQRAARGTARRTRRTAAETTGALGIPDPSSSDTPAPEVTMGDPPSADATSEKTRAYDFVLPFRTEGWDAGWANRILVQSQFYAGDAGSVSHKNVDQTKAARRAILTEHPTVRFIEYVDGAGYFSSLNRDLQHLLAMDTTRDFVQVRSAPIRLRRELQALGFVSPLEIEHAVTQTSGDVEAVGVSLVADGYAQREVRRATQDATDRGVLGRTGDRLTLRDDRRAMVRRCFLLDALAIHGREVQPGTPAWAGSVLVPGDGPFFGLEMDEFVAIAVANGGALRDEIADSQTLLTDIKALSQQGLCIFGR